MNILVLQNKHLELFDLTYSVAVAEDPVVVDPVVVDPVVVDPVVVVAAVAVAAVAVVQFPADLPVELTVDYRILSKNRQL